MVMTTVRNMRQEQTALEIEAGARRSRKAMAVDMVNNLMNVNQFTGEATLNGESLDPREWTVTVDFLNGIGSHTESWWTFPSDELRAMFMLLKK